MAWDNATLQNMYNSMITPIIMMIAAAGLSGNGTVSHHTAAIPDSSYIWTPWADGEVPRLLPLHNNDIHARGDLTMSSFAYRLHICAQEVNFHKGSPPAATAMLQIFETLQSEILLQPQQCV